MTRSDLGRNDRNAVRPRLVTRPGPLSGVTVVEIGAAVAEYAGRLLGELGAIVIKVEPLEGSASRARGPFATSNVPHERASLHFWADNITKLSIRLDLTQQDGLDVLRRLIQRADVVLEGKNETRMFDGALAGLVADTNSRAVHVLISPFGEQSPWADQPWSELTALALGGIAGVCGYDVGDGIDRDALPIAPTGVHASTMGGVLAVIGVIAELLRRDNGDIQDPPRSIEVALHDAIAVSTESAVPIWSFGRMEARRHTGRHASPAMSPIWNVRCADGRFLSALPIYMNDRRFDELLGWLRSEMAEEDLDDPRFRDAATRDQEMPHIMDVVSRFCLRHTSEEVFHQAQSRGLAWSPIQSPDELLVDEYLNERNFFRSMDMLPFGNVRFAGVAYKGMASAYDSVDADLRPPELGQDSAEVLKWLGLSQERISALRLGGAV